MAVLFLTYIRDKGPLCLIGLMPNVYLSWDTITWMAAPVVYPRTKGSDKYVTKNPSWSKPRRTCIYKRQQKKGGKKPRKLPVMLLDIFRGQENTGSHTWNSPDKQVTAAATRTLAASRETRSTIPEVDILSNVIKSESGASRSVTLPIITLITAYVPGRR